MAALPLRQHEEPLVGNESSTEVIYLVIPPGSAAPARPVPKPWSLVESAALAYLTVRHGLAPTPFGQSVRAIGLMAGYAAIGATLLVAGYCLKTAIGFDAVPGTHVGGYVPAIGGK